MNRGEPEAHDINAIYSLSTTCGLIELTRVTLYVLLPAVYVSRYAKLQFEIAIPGLSSFIMVHHYTSVLNVPLFVAMISFNGIIDRAGNLPLLIMQQVQVLLHGRLLVGKC
jgi:hypothetical protein